MAGPEVYAESIQSGLMKFLPKPCGASMGFLTSAGRDYRRFFAALSGPRGAQDVMP